MGTVGPLKKLRTDEIADAIKIDIEKGIYPVGEPLIQESLARRYGVSRIPIREALKTLAAEGVIDVHPGAGTFVSTPNSDDIIEIFEIRVQLEPHLLRLSIPRLGPRDFEAAEAALEPTLKLNGGLSPFAQDQQFHDALFAGIDRPVHARIIRSLRTKIAGLYADDLFWATRSAPCLAEHRAILDAAKAGKEREATSLLIRHLMHAREALTAKAALREQFR